MGSDIMLEEQEKKKGKLTSRFYIGRTCGFYSDSLAYPSVCISSYEQHPEVGKLSWPH